MEDTTAKTIDFLRARLLAERSVSRTAKERANELAKRVTELEKQLKFVSLQRKKAEKAAADVLAILENHGKYDISEPIDSSSNEEEMSNDFVDDKHVGTEGLSGSEVESSSVNGKSLSWKNSKNTSRFHDKKYMDASRRRRNSFTSTGSSPRRVGKSCRQIRRREHRSGADVSPNKGRTSSVHNSADVATETSLEEPNTCNGHAVQNNGTDKEMKKALKHQAQFIARYEEQEKAQTEWEDKFRESGSTPENSWDHGTHSDVTEEMDETKAQSPSPPQPRDTEKHTPGSQQIDNGAADGNVSENLKTCTEPMLGHNMKSEPFDNQNQPQDLQGIPTNSSQSQVSSSQVKSIEPRLETQESPDKLGSVLEALQQAKLSLKQNLHKFPLLENRPTVPCYARPEDKFPVPFSSTGLFRLPTDYAYEETTIRANPLTYDPRLILTTYPPDEPYTGQFISGPFTQSFSRSASSLDDRFHIVPTFPYQEPIPKIPRPPLSALNPRMDAGIGMSIDPRSGVGSSAHNPRLGLVQNALDPRLGNNPQLVVQPASDRRLETGSMSPNSSARIPPPRRYETLRGGDVPLRNRLLYDDYMR